jgi:protein-tyrosine phosphatase
LSTDRGLSETAELPRAIPLEGASNARDLGGYRTRDGARVRFGHVFRSARLSGLTEADALRLRNEGIGRIVDLRGPAEAASHPSVLPGATVHPLSIDPSLGPALRAAAEQGEAGRPVIMGLMRDAYAAYATQWHHRYAQLFDLLLEPGAPALLFHCTAGKDRTGFAAALILAALGVSRDTIRADYLATTRLWHGTGQPIPDLPPVASSVLTSVHPEFLDSAFTAARSAHGSLDRYLEERLGLDRRRRDALRDLLLE